MLVIGRYENERVSIFFGNVEVVVTICKVDNKKVSLGFDAPKEVIIQRHGRHWKMPLRRPQENCYACYTKEIDSRHGDGA
ncbi:MAG TPA: carbon storage regulator [Sedimentisphaerales bacterium]|nr:carbon storage regulator [Sedimentisphaerales bacterium]